MGLQMTFSGFCPVPGCGSKATHSHPLTYNPDSGRYDLVMELPNAYKIPEPPPNRLIHESRGDVTPKDIVIEDMTTFGWHSVGQHVEAEILVDDGPVIRKRYR